MNLRTSCHGPKGVRKKQITHPEQLPVDHQCNLELTKLTHAPTKEAQIVLIRQVNV